MNARVYVGSKLQHTCEVVLEVNSNATAYSIMLHEYSTFYLFYSSISRHEGHLQSLNVVNNAF